MKKVVIHFAVISLLIIHISAGWKDEIKTIRAKYANANTIELEMQISLKDAQNKVYENFTSKIVKTAQNFYYKGIDYEVIANPNEKIMIMKEDKQIYVFPGPPKELDNEHEKWLLILDSFHLYSETDIEYTSGESGIKTISFKPVKSKYSKMQIEYSVALSEINKVRMFLKQTIEDKKSRNLDKPYIEIEYKKQKLNQKVSTNLFMVSKYVTKKGDAYELTENYKTYNLYVHPKRTEIKN